MKTFDDLVFSPHSKWKGAEQATIEFDNGNSLYVVTGGEAYGDKEHPYECIVSDVSSKKSPIITGFCTKIGINKLMEKLQNEI